MNQIESIVCDECKQEFSMNSVNINEVPIEIDGQALVLVYFACPKCDKIYRICLKDDRYEELKEDLEKTKKRIRQNHGSGNEELARWLQRMVECRHNRLKEYTIELSRKFPGAFIFAASENGEEKIIKYLP